MDLVISIDDAADSIMNIGKPKDTRDEKIKARMLYEQSKVSLAN